MWEAACVVCVLTTCLCGQVLCPRALHILALWQVLVGEGGREMPFGALDL